MKILHNPRCRKSRETLEIIKSQNMNCEIILYLKHKLTKKEMKKIIKMLNINPHELIRKEEELYKKRFKNKKLSNEEYINIMCEYPILMQRPIVIKDNKAVLGRPPINVLDLFNKK